MAFFNLTVQVPGQGAKPSISHFENEILTDAPECGKTNQLREKHQELMDATNTENLTAVWSPQYTARDVTGCQPIGCAAFLGYTSESPKEPLPEVCQLMWAHIEEPHSADQVLVGEGQRIWYKVLLRDISGSVVVGVSQRHALSLRLIKPHDASSRFGGRD